MRPEPGDRVGSDAVPGNPRPRTVTGVRLGDLAVRLAVDLPADAADVVVTGATHAGADFLAGVG
ncbi:UDP-N-acetylmuramoyl-L-alanyl-D-glutamate--2,6-diaminopimelate ligase, partial [Micromonospora sp. NPDC049580]